MRNLRPHILFCLISFYPFYLASSTLNNLSNILLPNGFKIEVFAEGIIGPRQMAEGSNGEIYIGSRKSGKIVLIQDRDKNGKTDYMRIIAENLNQPSGVSFYSGDLYIAEIDKIWKISDISAWLRANSNGLPQLELVTDNLPDDEWHGWKWMKHDSAGRIYVNVGAPCNVCVRDDERYASILRIDSNSYEIVARGVRNSVGFDWHPVTEELFFTDNGRDWLGDETPPCELNRVQNDGSFYGFPYHHGANIADPDFGSAKHGYELVPPVYEFEAHSAPTGLAFYDKDMFPEEYDNAAFITLHGSWNRSSKVGYKVVAAQFDKAGNLETLHDFMTGFLDGEKTIGRPAAPFILSDGSLLVSDDFQNLIYRVTFNQTD